MIAVYSDEKALTRGRVPDVGLYKLWCRYDMGGNVHTADFWIRIDMRLNISLTKQPFKNKKTNKRGIGR